MNKKNWVILGLILVVIAVVFGLSQLLSKPTIAPDAPVLLPDVSEAGIEITPPADTSAPTDTAAPTNTAAPTSTAAPTNTAESTHTVAPTDTAASTSTAAPIDLTAEAKAYLVVTVGSTIYQPIPLTKEGDYSVHQTQGDMTNVIHVTEDSVAMASSTCEGQDCVNQGTVSLENMSTRVLGNMIICLPNQVSLELCTPEQVDELLASLNETGTAQ